MIRCWTSSQCSWCSSGLVWDRLGAWRTICAACSEHPDVAGWNAVEHSIAIVEPWQYHRQVSVQVELSADGECGIRLGCGNCTIVQLLKCASQKSGADLGWLRTPSFRWLAADRPRRQWRTIRLMSARSWCAVQIIQVRWSVLLICPGWAAGRSACTTVWRRQYMWQEQNRPSGRCVVGVHRRVQLILRHTKTLLLLKTHTKSSASDGAKSLIVSPNWMTEISVALVDVC